MKSNYFKISAVASSLLLAMSAHAAIPEGASFKGYALYGAGSSNSDILNHAAYDWAVNGINVFRLDGNHYNTSGGRLGNEANWLEMHFGYGWAPTNGMNWGVKANVVYGNQLDLDELYAEASGVFKSNPDATLWMGKRYWGRVDTFLTDTLPLQNDGYGFGIEKVDVGFADLELGVTRNLYNTNKDDYPTVTQSEGDMVAFQSALKGIYLADQWTLNLYANYGTYLGSSRNETTKDLNPDAYQVAALVRQGDWTNWNQFFVRYSHETSHGITNAFEVKPKSQIGAFWEGVREFGKYRLNYLWQHETRDLDRDARATDWAAHLTGVNKTHWNAFVIRQGYSWNERFTTELETGYESVKFKNEGSNNTNDGYKITLSQNVHINSGFWDRPVMRFFVTYASQDIAQQFSTNWSDPYGDFSYANSKIGKSNATTVGAMFEAWW